MNGQFPADFPGKEAYGKGFEASSFNPCAEVPLKDDRPFQSTTRRGLAVDQIWIMGTLCPGTLLGQRRQLAIQHEESCRYVFESRLGIVVAVHGTKMQDQVDVVWSSWSPDAA